MTKKEFYELVIKNELGNCSDEEKKLLYAYCNQVQEINKIADWELSEIEKSRLNTLQRITTTISAHQPQNRKNKHIKWISVAASIALILSMSIYLFIQQQNSVIIPENAITLTMGNGQVVPIDEHKNQSIIDEKGIIIGQQTGHLLTYNQGEKTEAAEVHKISVPYGKTFKVKLGDGTNVHLNAGSVISYSTSFTGKKERKVSLTGEAFLEVAKDANHPFIVQATQFQVRVFGTQFNIHAYPEDNIKEVVLVEGSVGLYTGAEQDVNPDSVMLEPGYKGSFNKHKSNFSALPVSTDQYTSWIEGDLVIRNLSFDDILKKLERHYNVKIINKNSALSKEVFNANFGKNPSIQEVLQELKFAYGFSYDIKKNLIIID